MDNSVSLLLQTLTEASSQDLSVLRPAEERLRCWEREPGFYSSLVKLYSDRSLDVNIRWLAVLTVKNGVDRYWRRTIPKDRVIVSDEERSFIKAQLIASFEEESSLVATQVAVLIGKIARQDTKIWPDLLPTLLQSVRHPNQLIQLRSLQVLQHVIKALASKRLSCDKQLFRQVASDVFSYIFNLWKTHLEIFQDLVSRQDANMHISLEYVLLTLKVLRKLLLFGMKDFEPDSEAVQLMRMVMEKTSFLLQCRASFLSTNFEMSEKLEKTLVLFTKVLLDAQSYHKMSYICLLQESLQYAVSFVFTPQFSGLLFERFTVQCCNLIKAIVKCDSYMPPKIKKEDADPDLLKAWKIIREFFSPPVLSEIIKCLVSQYFLITNEELEDWETDPEGYVNEEAGESWIYQLRPSTEVLFLSLLHEFRPIVTPLIIDMVKSLQELPENESNSHLLQQEAVYNAAGLASYDLFEEINFDEWFTQHLLKHLQNKNQSHKIIRRRVIWLIGQWINVKFSATLRGALYSSVIMLMDPSEDLVVRLTAANTLKLSVDDFEFTTDSFLPFLESTTARLFTLLQQVQQCETKMHVLHVMSLVIERVGSEIRPYAESLSSYLPLLWQGSGEHNMLRCAILTTLTHLVKGLGPLCVNLYPFLLPVIQFSTDVTEPHHVYLLEDGLELWHVTVQNSSRYSEDLSRLFTNMDSLLEIGSENLRTCFSIVDSYVLIGKMDFLKVHGSAVVNACVNMMGKIRIEGNIILAKTTDTIVRALPVDSPPLIQPVLVKVTELILKDEEYPPLMSILLSICGRILLQNSEYFFSLMQAIAAQLQQESHALVGRLLDVWLDKLDNTTNPERRKLTVLALTSLLSRGAGFVADRFALIVDAAVDVLHEVHRHEDGEAAFDSMVLVGPEDDNSAGLEHEVEEDARKRELCIQDPVYRVPLWQFVRDRLNECRATYGETGFQALLETVDSAVAKQLMSFINQ